MVVSSVLKKFAYNISIYEVYDLRRKHMYACMGGWQDVEEHILQSR